MSDEEILLYAPRILSMVQDLTHVLSTADLKLCVSLSGPIASKGRGVPEEGLYLDILRERCGDVVFCLVEDVPRFLSDKDRLVRILASHRLEVGL